MSKKTREQTQTQTQDETAKQEEKTSGVAASDVGGIDADGIDLEALVDSDAHTTEALQRLSKNQLIDLVMAYQQSALFFKNKTKIFDSANQARVRDFQLYKRESAQQLQEVFKDLERMKNLSNYNDGRAALLYDAFVITHDTLLRYSGVSSWTEDGKFIGGSNAENHPSTDAKLALQHFTVVAVKQ